MYIVLHSGFWWAPRPLSQHFVLRSAAVQQMQFDGLVPGEIYNLSVAAVSAAGVGPFTQELVAWIAGIGLGLGPT